MIDRKESTRLEHWFMDEMNTRIKYDVDYIGVLWVSCEQQLKMFVHDIVKYYPRAVSYKRNRIMFENGGTLYVYIAESNICSVKQAHQVAGMQYLTIAYTQEALSKFDDSRYHIAYMQSRMRSVSEVSHPRLSII